MIDVDKLEAGPELDILIAKDVMGWHTFTATSPEWRTQLRDKGIQCVRFISHPIEVRRYEGMRFTGYWNPSSADGIVAACEVLIQFDFPNLSDDGEGAGNNRWQCSVQKGKSCNRPLKLFHGFAPTAPLAICRAALKAVEAAEKQ